MFLFQCSVCQKSVRMRLLGFLLGVSCKILKVRSNNQKRGDETIPKTTVFAIFIILWGNLELIFLNSFVSSKTLPTPPQALNFQWENLFNRLSIDSLNKSTQYSPFF